MHLKLALGFTLFTCIFLFCDTAPNFNKRNVVLFFTRPDVDVCGSIDDVGIQFLKFPVNGIIESSDDIPSQYLNLLSVNSENPNCCCMFNKYLKELTEWASREKNLVTAIVSSVKKSMDFNDELSTGTFGTYKYTLNIPVGVKQANRDKIAEPLDPFRFSRQNDYDAGKASPKQNKNLNNNNINQEMPLLYKYYKNDKDIYDDNDKNLPEVSGFNSNNVNMRVFSFENDKNEERFPILSTNHPDTLNLDEIPPTEKNDEQQILLSGMNNKYDEENMEFPPLEYEKDGPIILDFNPKNGFSVDHRFKSLVPAILEYKSDAFDHQKLPFRPNGQKMENPIKIDYGNAKQIMTDIPILSGDTRFPQINLYKIQDSNREELPPLVNNKNANDRMPAVIDYNPEDNGKESEPFNYNNNNNNYNIQNDLSVDDAAPLDNSNGPTEVVIKESSVPKLDVNKNKHPLNPDHLKIVFPPIKFANDKNSYSIINPIYPNGLIINGAQALTLGPSKNVNFPDTNFPSLNNNKGKENSDIPANVVNIDENPMKFGRINPYNPPNMRIETLQIPSLQEQKDKISGDDVKDQPVLYEQSMEQYPLLNYDNNRKRLPILIGTLNENNPLENFEQITALQQSQNDQNPLNLDKLPPLKYDRKNNRKFSIINAYNLEGSNKDRDREGPFYENDDTVQDDESVKDLRNNINEQQLEDEIQKQINLNHEEVKTATQKFFEFITPLSILEKLRDLFANTFINPSDKRDVNFEENCVDRTVLGTIQDKPLYNLVRTTLPKLQNQCYYGSVVNGFLLVVIGGNLSEISDPFSDLVQSVKYVLENTNKQETLVLVACHCPNYQSAKEEKRHVPFYARGVNSERFKKSAHMWDLMERVRDTLQHPWRKGKTKANQVKNNDQKTNEHVTQRINHQQGLNDNTEVGRRLVRSISNSSSVCAKYFYFFFIQLIVYSVF